MTAPLAPMPHTTTSTHQASLLREVAEVLMWEITVIDRGDWQALPELTARKNTLRDRMRDFQWKPPVILEHENPEQLFLQAQVLDLEYQVRRKLESQISRLRTHLAEVQTRRKNIRRSLAPYIPTP